MWLPIVLAVLMGYLLGNLNGAVCISKLVAHEDVREHGSGNAGLTNFIRNYGAGKGLLVIVIDGGKAMLACLIGGLLLEKYGLPTECPFTTEQLYAVALSDKKRAGGTITLVVPYGVADSRLVTVPVDALEGYIRAGLAD